MTDTTRTPESTGNAPLAFNDRTRRVMELRKQVREGTYRPDPEEIAIAMLREWASAGELVSGDAALPPIDAITDRREFGERFTVQKTATEPVEGSRFLTA